MSHFQLSCLIELPADPWEAAKVVAKTEAPWQQLIAGLVEAGVTHTHTASNTKDSRAKAEKPAGTKRARKPKLPFMPAPTPNGGDLLDTETSP